MDVELAPAPRSGRSLWLGAALCGFAGILRRLPLAPLPRIATALVAGACTAAATLALQSELRPRQQEQHAPAQGGGQHVVLLPQQVPHLAS